MYRCRDLLVSSGLILLIVAGCGASTSAGSVPVTDESISEAEIRRCAAGDTCIVVAYDHCCGSTQRAINQRYEAAYAAHPEWQSYHGGACAFMGACAPDEHLNHARCDVDSGLCELTE